MKSLDGYIQAIILLILVISTVKGAPTVQADVVVEEIRGGVPAKYDNYIIDGPLNLNELKKINKTLHFNSTIFNGTVNSEGAIFNGDAYFKGAKFNEDANFEGAQFNKDACFGGSVFKRNAIYRKSQFNSITDFTGSQFGCSAIFIGTQFNRLAEFPRSRFEGFVQFTESRFNSHVDFYNSSFANYADFKGSQFNSSVYFVESLFNGSANFNGSLFNGSADFIRTQFNSSASFEKSNFRDLAYFSDATFLSDAVFNNCRFKEDALFEDADIKDKLYLKRTKYNNLYIRWNNITKLAYEDTAYLSLMENFKKLGYFKDYDDCYYAYRVEHRDQSRLRMGSWERYVDMFLQYSYGYGKKPIRPLIWSMISAFCFCIIWTVAYWEKERREIQVDEIFLLAQYKNRGMEDVLFLIPQALIFSITVFLSGAKLFVDPPKIPEISGVPNIIINIIFNFERLLGALFSILFFLALGETILR